jgi:hypothetical protein
MLEKSSNLKHISIGYADGPDSRSSDDHEGSSDREERRFDLAGIMRFLEEHCGTLKTISVGPWAQHEERLTCMVYDSDKDFFNVSNYPELERIRIVPSLIKLHASVEACPSRTALGSGRTKGGAD